MKTINRFACACFLLVAIGAAMGTQVVGMTMNEPVSAGTGADAEAGTTVQLGTLEIGSGYAKAMLPGQRVGGGYLSIRNTGDTDDQLVGASSTNAGAVEIHEMSMQGQIMKMRKLDSGLAIPAGQTITLAPGGFHLMFLSPMSPFKAGDQLSVTLTFAKAGKVEVIMPVRAAGPAPRP